MNKKSLIFLLTIHLVISLKSNDFCILKHKECKGLLCDEESIKCQEPFNNDCGFNICSNKGSLNSFNLIVDLCLKTRLILFGKS